MPRMAPLIALAALASVATAAMLGAITARAEPPQTANATATPETPCMPDFATTVWPETVLLGETVDVTLTVNVVCAGEPVPRHIALVLDASDSMRGDPQSARDGAARSVVSGLDLEHDPAARVAVTGFADDTQILSRLSNDEAAVLRAIGRAGPDAVGPRRRPPPGAGGLDHNTRLDLGIREAHRTLAVGRQGLDEPDIREAMVVFSDGWNNDGCTPVRKAASRVRGDGVLVVAVCTGSDCDERCMREVASSPRYFFDATNASVLRAFFQPLRDDYYVHIVVRQLEVHADLPPYLAYIPGSASPAQTAPAVPDDWLMWRETYVPREGVTYTFKARPQRPGFMPATDEAEGMFVDSKGRGKSWRFEVPWITVLQASPLATPQPTLRPDADARAATGAGGTE